MCFALTEIFYMLYKVGQEPANYDRHWALAFGPLQFGLLPFGQMRHALAILPLVIWPIATLPIVSFGQL